MEYIGIDVGGTNLVAGLVDERGAILQKVSRPVDRSMSDRALCRELSLLAEEVRLAGGLSRQDVQAVGVGLPGLVNNKQGVVVTTANMPFRDTPLRELFQQEWDVPIYLGNDANCAALGEYWAGAARGCNPTVMVTLGTGIGGGMVVNGKLFTGCANSGMEVGHMVIHPGGHLCGCGYRGCWEQYGSATALIRMTRQAMEKAPDSRLWALCDGDPEKVQGRTPFQAAKEGDATASQVLEEYRQEVAIGLINLINVLQPKVICLGGGISHAEDELLLEPLRELVERGSFDKRMPTRLVRASLGNDAGVVGAALLCKAV